MRFLRLAGIIWGVWLLTLTGLLMGLRLRDPVSRWLLFSSFQDGHTQLYLFDVSSHEISALTQHSFDDTNAAWSPDGRSLVFASNRTGNWEIYTMRLDGSRLRRLTHHFRDDLSPSWSADSRWIFFSSNREGSWEIYRVHLQGGEPERLTDNGNWNWMPQASHNGEYIGHVSRSRQGYDSIYLMSSDGSQHRSLLHTNGDDVHLSWSPDSEWIVFNAEMDTPDDNLYKVRVSDGKLIQLTAMPSRELFPSWSTDGRWIAFVSNQDQAWQMYVMRPDGTDQHRLSVSTSYSYWMPLWSPVVNLPFRGAWLLVGSLLLLSSCCIISVRN